MAADKSEHAPFFCFITNLNYLKKVEILTHSAFSKHQETNKQTKLYINKYS